MEKILSYIESNHERYLTELKELLAIPSVSSQTERKPEMRRTADMVRRLLFQEKLLSEIDAAIEVLEA